MFPRVAIVEHRPAGQGVWEQASMFQLPTKQSLDKALDYYSRLRSDLTQSGFVGEIRIATYSVSKGGFPDSIPYEVVSYIYLPPRRNY